MNKQRWQYSEALCSKTKNTGEIKSWKEKEELCFDAKRAIQFNTGHSKRQSWHNKAQMAQSQQPRLSTTMENSPCANHLLLLQEMLQCLGKTSTSFQ